MPKSSAAVSSAVDKFEDINSQLLTYGQLARNMNVCERTLEYWVAVRKIPYIKLGRKCVRFRLSDVQRALKRYEVKEVQL